MMDKKKAIVVIAMMSIALLNACTVGRQALVVGELQQEARSVALPNAGEVNVRIEMGVGALFVGGGAEGLMDAAFAYNVEALRPEIEQSGERLSILTPDTKFGLASLFDIQDFRNEWNLSFSDAIAINMDIDLGLGESTLQLGSLALERLFVDAGAGDLTLDLVGSSLESLRVEAGMGNVRIDLSGVRAQDLQVDIGAGIGAITIMLPREIGVRVDMDGGLTSIDAEEFSSRNGRFENDAYGASDTVIEIRVDAGVGQVNLILSD